MASASDDRSTTVTQDSEVVLTADKDGEIFDSHHEPVGKVIEPGQVSAFDGSVYFVDECGRVYNSSRERLGLILDGTVFDGEHNKVAHASGKLAGEAGAALLALQRIKGSGHISKSDLKSHLQHNPILIEQQWHDEGGGGGGGGKPQEPWERAAGLIALGAVVMTGLCFIAVAAMVALYTSPLWALQVVISCFIANRFIHIYRTGSDDPAKEWLNLRKSFAIKRHALFCALLYGVLFVAVIASFGRTRSTDLYMLFGVAIFGLIVSTWFLNRYAVWLLVRLNKAPSRDVSEWTYRLVNFVRLHSGHGAIGSSVIASLVLLIGLRSNPTVPISSGAVPISSFSGQATSTGSTSRSMTPTTATISSAGPLSGPWSAAESEAAAKSKPVRSLDSPQTSAGQATRSASNIPLKKSTADNQATPSYTPRSVISRNAGSAGAISSRHTARAQQFSDQDVSKLSRFELDCLRNDPFARHGYIFKRADLRDHFSRQSWYKPSTTDQHRIWGELSPDEKSLVTRVKKIEGLPLVN